jgi:hypothetical protein
MLYHALDHYFSLQYMGNLIVDTAVEQFMFRIGSEGSKIEKKQDEKGRTVYSVDWASFSGGNKAVLMCVCAATFPPVSGVFLDRVFLERGGQEKQDDALRSWHAITKGAVHTRAWQWSDFYEDGF